MSAQSNPPVDGTTARDYRSIQGSKRALERLLNIAESIERLHTGLQAVVLMGKPTAMIQKSALRYFGELSENTRILPSSKLKATLARLEERMTSDLARILQLAEKTPGPGEVEQLPASTAKLLDDFRRTAQTAVALRILLRERGEPTKATSLPAAQSLIRERVNAIAAQEGRYREKVKGDILRMQKDTRALLARNLPPPMRDMAEQTLAELQANLEHLEAGKALEELPHQLEVIEVGEEIIGTPAPEAAEPEEAPPPSAPEQAAPEQPAAKGQEPEHERGFVGRLNQWLNTPWSVSWKEIKRKDKK